VDLFNVKFKSMFGHSRVQSKFDSLNNMFETNVFLQVDEDSQTETPGGTYELVSVCFAAKEALI
jgi:hypothetical protein